MENAIKVVDKNEGTKIAYEQSGTKIFFGDEDLMINVAKYQKDYDVQIDVCMDEDDNLVISSGVWYVAQIDIPAAQYEKIDESSYGQGADIPAPAKLPIDMGQVTLTLWALKI